MSLWLFRAWVVVVDCVWAPVRAYVWSPTDFAFMYRTLQEVCGIRHRFTRLAVCHATHKLTMHTGSQGMSPVPDAAAAVSQMKLRNATAQETINNRNMNANQMVFVMLICGLRVCRFVFCRRARFECLTASSGSCEFQSVRTVARSR